MQNDEVTKYDDADVRRDALLNKGQGDSVLFRERFLWDPILAVDYLKRFHDCLRDFNAIANMRVKQESLYIQGISSLDNSSLTFPLFQLYNQRKPLVSQFMDDVNEEIIKPIDKYLTRHGTVLDDLQKDQQTLLETKHSLLRALSRSADIIYQTRAANKSLGSKNDPDKMVSLCKMHVHYITELDNHQRLQEALNSFINETYKPSMSTILNMYQDIVQSAEDLLNDCSRKMMVFEVSLNRGFQYDLDRFAANDAHSLSILPPTTLPAPRVASNFTLPKIDEITDLFTRSRSNFSDYPKLKPLICSEAEIDVNEIESIRIQLKDNRSHLSFFQSVESDLSSFATITAIKNLGRLVWALLDDCDTESIRRVCCLARRVCCTDLNGRKKFLQSEVYDHPIWNRIKVWQDMLIFTIAETVCSISSVDFSIDEFGTFILIFGLSFDSARKLIKKVIDDSFSWYSGKDTILDRLIKGLDKAAERQLRHHSCVSPNP
jgi:hypothetical protein